MARIAALAGTVAIAGLLSAGPVLAQDHDHTGADADAHGHVDTDTHSHAGPVVSCTDLAAPPWNGLSDADRARVEELRQTLAGLSTPEAALAAGFRPALGDIPGMGVHYVNPGRMLDGVRVDAPDHLLFATVDGEERLVGTAYAFMDVPDTQEPLPFESELAHWHDHPQFAPDGRTLHMLHVWFIPSSNGPFAGLNFWLPFEAADIAPPSACWMANQEDAERIQRVSFSLAPREWGDGGAAVISADLSAERREILTELDASAVAGDREAWMVAADRYLADLSPAEIEGMEAMLRALTMAQMSSADRDDVQH